MIECLEALCRLAPVLVNGGKLHVVSAHLTPALALTGVNNEHAFTDRVCIDKVRNGSLEVAFGPFRIPIGDVASKSSDEFERARMVHPSFGVRAIALGSVATDANCVLCVHKCRLIVASLAQHLGPITRGRCQRFTPCSTILLQP